MTVISTRISLVRAFFASLEDQIKAHKKMRKNQILSIFILLDIALINDLIDKRQFKALKKFINGETLDFHQSDERLLAGFYKIAIDEKQNHFLYPLPDQFVDMILDQFVDMILANTQMES